MQELVLFQSAMLSHTPNVVLAVAAEAADSRDISFFPGSDALLASAPVGLDHGQQRAKLLLNIVLTGSLTGLRMHPEVLGQLGLIEEALPAVIAGKGPFRPVDALVPPHVSPVPKVLVTLRAAEGSLPGVEALVAEQLRIQAEALVTGSTLEGLLPGVRADVLGELGPLGEALAAGAGEGHLPTVQQLVRLHIGLHTEALVALRALERPLARVHALVAEQLRLQAEAAVALGAAEGALAAVHAQVLGELGLVREALGTLRA